MSKSEAGARPKRNPKQKPNNNNNKPRLDFRNRNVNAMEKKTSKTRYDLLLETKNPKCAPLGGPPVNNTENKMADSVPATAWNARTFQTVASARERGVGPW